MEFNQPNIYESLLQKSVSLYGFLYVNEHLEIVLGMSQDLFYS